ncbi:hypothetical protein [Streptomyces sp. AN091965]|uniref:hypothetical protein n=1 Tax=Streptomyces sp. AN091965 TaxID=2927803 RepID=UPI001F617FF0|nr:hypothetical protein [Streptomyces sp. AN091965]MCI3931699.1 hypothetical protein [Streptomyces sp. AN091965]
MHPRPAMNPRLLALLGIVAVAALLPLAGAAAGPVFDDTKAPADPGRAGARPPEPGTSVPEAGARGASRAEPPLRPHGAGGGPGAAGRPGATDDPGAARAADAALQPDTLSRCGPELSSPDGVEAQTCVLTQGADTWARTYYRNVTGEALEAVLSVMGPRGRTVQMYCAVGAGDEPGACDTPKERTSGAAARYTAVAEFASESGGALLLRSGSNSAGPQGS